MEDKLQIKTEIITEIKDFIINNAYFNLNFEICGLLGFDEESQKYIAEIQKNESPDPKNYFIINPIDYLNFKNKYSLIAVFHSHIIYDEKPSEFDIKISESTCLPFIIFSINSKKFYIYEPKYKDYKIDFLEKIKLKFIEEIE
jgi:proteasome lid subunit RPN8/RPN11